MEQNLCKCGCGIKVKKTWKRGHSRKGVKLSKTHREAISKRQKENSYFHIYNKTEKHRKKVITSNKKRKVTEETKKKISNSLLGFKHSDETKLKMKITRIDKDNYGKKAPGYKHGKGNKRGFQFRKIRGEIRKRDNYICQSCGTKSNGKLSLDVHHIDFDKYNDSPKNLEALCRKCHKRKDKNKTKMCLT